MRQLHTVVIGGGIAGLSVAWGLARGGARRVTVLETEAALGTHSSARNAQIWLPVDDDETTAPLALEGAAAMSRLVGGEARWLKRTGAIALADAARAAGVERGAEKSELGLRSLTARELRAHGVEAHTDAGFHLAGAGVFDPHTMITALAAACRDAGVELRASAAVGGIEASGRVSGVRLAGSGERVRCDECVIAAGAWAGGLGEAVGASVPLVPLRRHLAVLEARSTVIVWSFTDAPVYWRPESGGTLASPCDELAFDPCVPPADPAALEQLAARLEPLAPALVEAPVRTAWACLRTYAHDRELALGPDPRLPGLAWLAGLGGRGMTVGLGAGLRCAAAMLEDRPLDPITRPDRAQPAALIEA